MNGVTVVNTVQGICGYGDGITVGFMILAFLAFFLAVFAFFAIYVLIAEKDFAAFVPFIFSVSFAIIFGVAANAQYHAKPIYGPQQVVFVDDTVNFNEFMDRYEIIKQEGQLYTIREK